MDASPQDRDDELANATVSFGISTAITSVISALLVVLKEKVPAIMASMKSATGHHWATHSLFALVLFLTVGLGLTRVNGGQGLKMTSGRLLQVIVSGVVIGGSIIGGFYLFMD